MPRPAVRPLFSTLFELLVTPDAPAMAKTAAGRNAVETVANAVAAALANGRTAAGTAAAAFALSSNVWTQVSNLTSVADWASLSFFTVDSLQEYNVAPGTAGGVSSPNMDWVFFGVGFGVAVLLTLVAMGVFVLRLRRRHAHAERLAAEAIHASMLPLPPQTPSAAVAV